MYFVVEENIEKSVEPSPVERYTPVQLQVEKDHSTHALPNGNTQTTIRDSNPWHQREEEVHDEKSPSRRESYHRNSRPPSGYDEPDANEMYEQQRQQKLQVRFEIVTPVTLIIVSTHR